MNRKNEAYVLIGMLVVVLFLLKVIVTFIDLYPEYLVHGTTLATVFVSKWLIDLVKFIFGKSIF